MAYFSPLDPESSQPIARPAASQRANLQIGFTELEWSIIRLAQVDRLWTIRKQGRLARAWNRWIGRGNPELANPQLEALRRISVLSWHYGFTVPGEDVVEFLSAGFSADQYELLVSTVSRWARPTLYHSSTAELA